MSSIFSLSTNTYVKTSFSHDYATIKCRKAQLPLDFKMINNTSNILELPRHGISHTDLRLGEIVDRQSNPNNIATENAFRRKSEFGTSFLEEAYERCRHLCAEYAKTFYLGTLLMTEERQKAIWAIYLWCRRTDELVDGPNAMHMSAAVLDRWEERLEDIFNGHPYDMLDAALTDTVYKFPLDIKPFRDMIEGMRMDTRKSRYESFEELYLYCYYVAGTVGLMSVPVMGIAPESPKNRVHGVNFFLIHHKCHNSALRGRVYLPQDELHQFGLCDKYIFARKVSGGWREFMKKQITRARFYFNQAEEGTSHLDKDSRWPVWSSLMLYREILDAIEDNDYDNLTKRAYVGGTKKLLMLPLAYTRSLSVPRFVSQ
ncbi:hypothetical protein GIB67_019769 [Kingdonia uniflora]|uniref:15-cis-phytoene synthase n=1 Tax=Kingdonia uniflora TaxID=39325 RepID=A0A7J7MK30_9MAGN|nr:hypothetical protein GIB67_019769 [Kingdonia uniflora]